MLPMPSEQAESLAIQVLGWLAADSELFAVFLGATGCDVTSARSRAQEPEFLASVVDFLLMDDAWVQGFCDAEGHPYEAPMRARGGLPGGDLRNWT